MKRMIKFMALVLVALVPVMMTAHNDRTALISKNVPVKTFTKVMLTSSDNIIYTQGTKHKVTIRGTKKQVEAVVVNQNGNVLEVSRKSSVGNILRGDNTATIYITSPNIAGVTVKGSGDFDARSIKSANMNILLKGSGDIEIDNIVCSQALTVKVDGSGDIDIHRAECKKSDIELKGSGDVDIAQVGTNKTSVSLLGSGDIDLKCRDCNEVNASILGSGDIEIEGQYKSLIKNRKGSGNIIVK